MESPEVLENAFHPQPVALLDGYNEKLGKANFGTSKAFGLAYD